MATNELERLCSISSENDGVEKIIGYKLNRQFDPGYDAYSINMDRENGAMFFEHNTLEHVGAAYNTANRYSKRVSFDDVKALLPFEQNRYKSLVEMWAKENNSERVKSCQERLEQLEKIMNTKESDWKDLLGL